MGKPTGFLEYQREAAASRSPVKRIGDWQEIYLDVTDGHLQQQSARCMDCGVPYCHTGKLIDGLAIGCPINNLIPEWNDLIYRGLWRQALDRLRKTNNFPEFTGRVCPAPCEGSCTAGLNDGPVTIKNIEYAIINKGYDFGWITPEPPAVRTGKRVAIVGSGPAGLACADELNRAGHQVTVYERDDRVGGLLMYGIPSMKLDKKTVQRRVDLMVSEGVLFETGVEIGKDISAEQLQTEYDAVVLCAGAGKPRNLPAPGRELAGIHFALEFLSGNTKAMLDGTEPPISATGKDVIVIGGGDTGTDCVGASLRQGCQSVIQFEILDRPPDVRQPDNPWPEWPKIFRVDYGQEEAAAITGEDPRIYAIMTQKFVGDEQGRVREIHTIDIEWVSGNNGNRPVPKEIPGTERVWPAQLVLLSMGFLGPEDRLPNAFDAQRDARSNVKAAYGEFSTNIPGVFAAGDMRRGQSLVVWAINEGRGAAAACDRYLMGE
jgi:glutamate synthase (NADPH/NADH) small chain